MAAPATPAAAPARTQKPTSEHLRVAQAVYGAVAAVPDAV